MAEKEENGKKRPLSRSEKFRNYCIGIAALTGLILGVVNIVMGEPTAKKAWETSEKAINKNRRAINKLGDGMRKLHLMFVHMQGQTEGYNNAKLLHKIEKLEEINERLRQGKPVVKREATSGATSAPASKPEAVVEVLRGDKPCHPGWVRIKGKCTKNRAAIAKAAVEAQKSAAAVKVKLVKERRLRKAAERAKAQMQQIRIPEPKPPPKLAPMPKNLDEASKLGK